MEEIKFWTQQEIDDLKLYYPIKDVKWLKAYF
jgi:hypothetical protein